MTWLKALQSGVTEQSDPLRLVDPPLIEPAGSMRAGPTAAQGWLLAHPRVMQLVNFGMVGGMAFVVDIHQDSSVLELFEVRRILEPTAAAMAASRATPEHIARLRDMLTEVDENTSIDGLVAHDMLFHRHISTMSGNAYLTSLLDGLSGKTLRARVWRGLTQEHSVERTLAEHHAIVDALASGDAEVVRALVIVHISGVEQWLRRAVS